MKIWFFTMNKLKMAITNMDQKDGYDFLQFDHNHIHKDTGTRLSPLEFDIYGYNPNRGIVCQTFMRFIHDPPYSNPKIIEVIIVLDLIEMGLTK